MIKRGIFTVLCCAAVLVMLFAPSHGFADETTAPNELSTEQAQQEDSAESTEKAEEFSFLSVPCRGQLKLSWKHSEYYNVYRIYLSEDGESYRLLGDEDENDNYIINRLSPEKRYCVYVSAVHYVPQEEPVITQAPPQVIRVK